MHVSITQYLSMWSVTVVIVAFILPISYASSSSANHGDATVEYTNLLNKSKSLYEALSPSFSEQEIKCFEIGLFAYAGECYLPFGRGPCENGKQLVYDKQGSGAVCRRNYCPEEYRFIREYKKCFHIHDVSNVFCRNKTYVVDDGHAELYSSLYVMDVFGEQHCVCPFGTGRLYADDGNCYRFYKRGPCKFGQVFIPVNNGIVVGYGTCVEDPCLDYVDNVTYGVIRVNAESGNSMCYSLMSEGPCPSLYILQLEKFLPNVYVPQCIYPRLTYGITVSAVSEFCVPNNDGECVTLTNPVLEPLEV